MRPRAGLLRLLLAPTLLALTGSLMLQAQSVGPGPERGPRFLIVSRGEHTLVDPGAVPALRRRVTTRLSRVPLERAIREISRQSGIRFAYSRDLIPASLPVSLEADQLSLAAALTEVLLDTGVDVVVTPSGQIALMPGTRIKPRLAAAPGSLRGRLVDSTTGHPIAQAEVRLAGMPLVTLTGPAGEFRMTGLPAGDHQVTMRRPGFRAVERAIRVNPGEEAVVEIATVAVIPVLDELIAAGSLVETRRRASPVPVAVLTERQIQTPSKNRIDQLFRGDIPGVIGYDLGAFNQSNAVFVRGRPSLDLFNLLKIYVDGVELPVTDLTSVVDLRGIERVELLRGPQGTSIYGSNASGGVLLLTTKAGARGPPRLAGMASAGVVSSRYARGTPAATEARLSLSGGTARVGYSTTASFESQGEILPEADTRQAALASRVQLGRGPFTMALTGSLSERRFGIPNFVAAAEIGVPEFAVPLHQRTMLRNAVIGASATWAPASWWSTSIQTGFDRAQMAIRTTEPVVPFEDDTLFYATDEAHDQLSFRIHSTVHGSLSRRAALTATGGLEVSHASGHNFTRLFDNADRSGIPRYESIDPPHSVTNRGALFQTVLGIDDRLFLTAGVRAEHTDAVGDLQGAVLAPRFGIAYSWSWSGGALKPRIAFGRSLRPPGPSYRFAGKTPFFEQLANPGLGMESQRGFDGGFDLELGNGAVSFEATYYDQVAEDLIDLVLVDPGRVPSLMQYQNVGSATNRGLELGLGVNRGPVHLRAAYSTTSSRLRSVGAGYTGVLQPRDPLLYSAATVAGATATLELPWLRSDVDLPTPELELGLTYIGSRWTQDYLALIRCRYLNQGCRPSPRDYHGREPGIAKLRAAVAYPLGKSLEGFLNVDNLFNSQVNEMFNILPSRGRKVLVGVRFGH